MGRSKVPTQWGTSFVETLWNIEKQEIAQNSSGKRTSFSSVNFLKTQDEGKAKKKYTTSDRNTFDGSKIIKFRCDFVGSTQINVMLARGWIQLTDARDTSWHLWWCERSEVRNALDSKLDSRQKIPHFRNHYELTRKDYLWRNLKRYGKSLRKSGKIREAELANSMPITFELPTEYRMLVEEYNRQGGGTWIVKPAAGSQGRGIFLFKKLKELADWRMRESTTRQTNDETGNNAGESFVVQKYLEDPYLLAGRKFDLRIYVLVTSFRPLKVWLAREGFARLSGELFSLDRIDDSRVHLTNMSIQLKVETPRETRVDETRTEASSAATRDCYDDGSAFKRGRKWSLTGVREFLSARHGSRKVEMLLERVAGVVMASLLAVQPSMMHTSNSFELYGYDIIIDKNFKPWLLEVNASPALTPTDEADHRLKRDILEDLLNVLDFEGLLTGREIRVGGFDLLWNAGPVWRYCRNGIFADKDENLEECTRNSRKLNIFLGAWNDRSEQLERLRESLATRRNIG